MMDRREFLKSSGVVAAASVLPSVCSASPTNEMVVLYLTADDSCQYVQAELFAVDREKRRLALAQVMCGESQVVETETLFPGRRHIGRYYMYYMLVDGRTTKWWKGIHRQLAWPKVDMCLVVETPQQYQPYQPLGFRDLPTIAAGCIASGANSGGEIGRVKLPCGKRISMYGCLVSRDGTLCISD